MRKTAIFLAGALLALLLLVGVAAATFVLLAAEWVRAMP